MREQTENGVKIIGRIVLQVLGPAILAVFGSYFAVSIKVARVEERIEAMRLEIKIRQEYLSRDLEALQKVTAENRERIEVILRQNAGALKTGK